MTAVPKQKLTEAEYLARERVAEFKSEFFNGEMFPVHGEHRPCDRVGSPIEHDLIKENLKTALASALSGSIYRVVTGTGRVGVSASQQCSAPDIMIVSEPIAVTRVGVVDPHVVIEVVTPESEREDRGAKFRHYRKGSSVREYLFVSQTERVCEQFVRQPNETWVLTSVTDPIGELVFASVPARIPLADVYAGVVLSGDSATGLSPGENLDK